jgi:hypothetical protein
MDERTRLDLNIRSVCLIQQLTIDGAQLFQIRLYFQRPRTRQFSKFLGVGPLYHVKIGHFCRKPFFLI